jgi:hypothetical protein
MSSLSGLNFYPVNALIYTLGIAIGKSDGLVGKWLLQKKYVATLDFKGQMLAVLPFFSFLAQGSDAKQLVPKDFKLDSLGTTEKIVLNQHWKFHPGDDPSWANPDFDDGDWFVMPFV